MQAKPQPAYCNPTSLDFTDSLGRMRTKSTANALKNILRTSCLGFFIASVFLMQPQYANAQSTEEMTLNLANADILSLIETVSRRTGKNFIVDPRVKAKVTIISSESISADKLYELFLSVLAVHGFAAVPVGNMIKIVPLAAGVQSAVPVLGEHSVPGDELITEIIHVENISALQVVEVLRPLVPAPVSLSAEANSNSVVITDRAANIARLREIIFSLDNSQ